MKEREGEKREWRKINHKRKDFLQESGKRKRSGRRNEEVLKLQPLLH